MRFDVHTFRPGQRQVMEGVLASRDVVGIMPTGAGKSLCYQLPALFLDGCTVVVSPLISLMQDQQEKLAGVDIDAAKLNSTLSAGEGMTTEVKLDSPLGIVVTGCENPAADRRIDGELFAQLTHETRFE